MSYDAVIRSSFRTFYEKTNVLSADSLCSVIRAFCIETPMFTVSDVLRNFMYICEKELSKDKKHCLQTRREAIETICNEDHTLSICDEITTTTTTANNTTLYVLGAVAGFIILLFLIALLLMKLRRNRKGKNDQQIESTSTKFETGNTTTVARL
ncbi:unnamed protein product [Caenorhabditis sp. 36 PRJEB53466]|nr:unnamed protein product [Caenorhabditis sp. 36 PRJEB53466]